MKAQVLREESGPGGLELVEVDDLTAGPGQYLVDIKACGVCPRPPHEPRALPDAPTAAVHAGHRGRRRSARGAGGGKYKVGDKVLCSPASAASPSRPSPSSRRSCRSPGPDLRRGRSHGHQLPDRDLCAQTARAYRARRGCGRARRSWRRRCGVHPRRQGDGAKVIAVVHRRAPSRCCATPVPTRWCNLTRAGASA